MTAEHFKSITEGQDRIYKSACAFILGLRRAGVPLSVIITNDWSSCPTPRVYIDLRGYKGNYMKYGHIERNVRGYARHDAYGLKQAINFFKTA